MALLALTAAVLQLSAAASATAPHAQAPSAQPVVDVLTRVVGAEAAGHFSLTVDTTMQQVRCAWHALRGRGWPWAATPVNG
jgi:hypothetical protein